MAVNSSIKKSWMATMILCLVLAGFAANSQAQHAAPIVYKQTISQIVLRNQVMGWPAGNEASERRNFEGVVASADGSKVFFSVCEYNSGQCRPFVVNSNGTGVQDVSAIFPANLVSTWWGWGNMVIKDDGSEVFIEVGLDDGKDYIQYLNTSTMVTGQAVSQWWWAGYSDWFTANSSASRLYTGKFDWGDIATASAETSEGSAHRPQRARCAVHGHLHPAVLRSVQQPQCAVVHGQLGAGRPLLLLLGELL